ncbi:MULTISPECIES: SDR family NAD(P)-dependent oxidoreductase [unclassified Sphingomonas]|uniref:SDR family NAD(P)-dependent oxidoreductase n=1 Tax=unclassified Sphingomonas TaxID=196159 RepID=UPI0006FFF253|nr:MULTISPECIES: glucose 1-dehydrogenase [unclassified Sphingomonas]KQX26038.1 3-beta hydroxysteroid dehydrogenase [Sphingomonas sp. Root1294]KQY69104.1 3-beta hydroxysteroid dehydrogenase [Sphingomonas sp. Root50]KRB89359.1 3-beta hydroxysteroid dehydrogenase [Sphingomonas sp. Root720]
MRLKDKVAIVTGAASGIGRATALTFAREGARVVVADLNEDGASATAATIGDAAFALRLDVADEAGWAEATRRTADRFGRLDILANVAGIGFPGTILDLTMDQWNRMIAVNLTGVMLGCQAAIRTIAATGGSGAIVNVSSLAGLIGISDVAGYCGSKGGVTTLSKSVALYCAEQGLPIRCVSVHPTYVDSEMLDPVADAVGGRQAMLEAMARLVPIGRIATPQDIANAILFAASDEAAMMSGHALVIDGAQLAGPSSAHTKG